MVESLNFEFLRKHRRELADLGGFAETYVFSDPSSSLFKLRQLAEAVVQGIYSDLKLQRSYSANLKPGRRFSSRSYLTLIFLVFSSDMIF